MTQTSPLPAPCHFALDALFFCSIWQTLHTVPISPSQCPGLPELPPRSTSEWKRSATGCLHPQSFQCLKMLKTYFISCRTLFIFLIFHFTNWSSFITSKPGMTQLLSSLLLLNHKIFHLSLESISSFTPHQMDQSARLHCLSPLLLRFSHMSSLSPLWWAYKPSCCDLSIMQTWSQPSLKFSICLSLIQNAKT